MTDHNIIYANSLIGLMRNARTAATWRAVGGALDDASLRGVLWDDLVAAANLRATEAEEHEQRQLQRLHENQFQAALAWMLSLVAQYAGTSQEKFAREVVLAATNDQVVGDDARAWLMRLTARGTEEHRAWAERLMRECGE
jgi:hypothetical protein